MNKKALRNQIIDALKQTQHVDHNLYQQLFAHPDWQSAKTVAVTLSSAIELDTNPIIRQALSEGKRIVIPRTLPGFQMEFVTYDDQTQLFKTRFGIMEPANGSGLAKALIDLIIVPGLAFASQTHDRLGFGGGFYDRYLADYQGATVSLALPAQLFDQPNWDVDRYDIKVQTIIS
ncbi:5-formyltetrahydrofolate cyclo-ligase [Lactobacillus sp. Sy-1]|uniref:5-formyltetrahydrofolate cyclo-ligase n=1 Tax=Lactobacillus sp. Sy-1 TaxID=2109645 RepID=UPI001C574F72|nr:5-formyltetrahydrofolate cyclo-ligase [Lactobacillus sp. Sy-1]MBW1605669.1 5-formyltetrahydrofolate cyclo-ligase [Lactobacillus sp. Sy-1]